MNIGQKVGLITFQNLLPYCFLASAFYVTSYSFTTDSTASAVPLLQTAAAPCNFLLNPEFDSGTSNWTTYNQTGYSSTLSVDNTSQLSGLNSALINITTAPATKIHWDVQFVQTNVSLEAGKEYVVSFQAKADIDRSISLYIQESASPYTSYFYQSVDLTPTAETYGEFSFIAPATDPTATLGFNLGDTTGLVHIDEVVFCTGLPDLFIASDLDQMLTSVNAGTWSETVMGSTGTFDVEAIEFDPISSTLFGAANSSLRSFDIITGATTYVGDFSPSDDAVGVQGILGFDDVDGLARDPVNDIWYGVSRRGNLIDCGDNDVLFQFDPGTGNYIPGVFSDFNSDTNPDDYVVVQPPSSNPCLHYMDDLCFDPNNGKLYGLANGQGTHSDSSVLVEINPLTGAVVDLGTIVFDPGTGAVLLDDVEGLTVDLDGNFFVTTGNYSVHSDSLFELSGIGSGSDITATYRTALAFEDNEAITALTYSSPSQIGDFIFNDLNGDGDFDGGESGIVGVNVLLLNPTTGDTVSMTMTNGSGNYSFSGLPPGQFNVVIDDLNFNSGGPLENYFATMDRENNWDNEATSIVLSAGTDDLDLDFGYKVISVENCANGVDDDGDGYADCFDSECPCFAPIDCDGTLYQTITIAGDFWLYEVRTNPVSLNPLVNLTSAGVTGNINNAYYKNSDGFIYFMSPNSPYQLYRVNGLYDVEFVGTVSGFPSETVNAAANSNTGAVYFRTPSTGDFYLLDETTLTASLSCDFPASAWPETNIGDFAFNPITEKYYGTRDDTDMLIEIDPVACTQDTIMLSDTITGALGAFFVSADGTGYGYANSTGDLYKIDLTSGLIDTIGAGSTTSNTDGCSCSTVLMTNSIASDTICLSDTITYTFTIFNHVGALLSNLTFHDTLNSGFTFSSDPYNITGITFTGSTAITGSNQADLAILSVNTGIANSFQIDVVVTPGTTLGTYSNQGYLSGLPPFLPLTIISDNPESIAVNDATDVLIQSCPEICGNGFDDDGNGGTDCGDLVCCCAQAPVLSK